MNEKDRKWLKKEIKQIKAVISAFNYKYFVPLNADDLTEIGRAHV